MTRRASNIRAVEKYVVHVRAARFPGTAGSVVDILQFTGKPESSAPHTSTGEKHLDHGENSETRRLLEPIIEEWLRRRYSDSWMLIEAAPTEIASWRLGANVEAKQTAWRFDRALAEVEREFERRNPGARLSVVVNPYHEPVASRREAADRDKTLTAQDSYRRIVASIERLETEDYSREAAKAEIADRLGCSIARIARAITFVNQEREGAA